MTSPDVVLHIGLHKTATRFLQRAVFARLDPQRFLVNPPGLNRALKQALWYPSEETRAQAREAVAKAREEAGDRTLLVSEPSISGDMYSSHEDWHRNLEFTHELFPDARIIYFVRRQSDWLHSAYRQSLVKGPGVPIGFFLNFRNGEFRTRSARMIGRARNLNALDLRFLDIYLGYATKFGARNVYLFRQEDLKQSSESVYLRLAQALGLEAVPDPPRKVSSNPAFSALGISIFFPGTHRRVDRIGPVRVHGRFEAKVDRRLKRIRTAVLRHVFDKIIYRDWDLLAQDNLREKLDAHFQAEWRLLSDAASDILANGPAEFVLDKVRREKVQDDCAPSVQSFSPESTDKATIR